MWQYDYTVYNDTDSISAPNANLYDVRFAYPGIHDAAAVGLPSDWAQISSAGEIEAFAVTGGAPPTGTEIPPGGSRTGFTLKFDYRAGNIPFIASFITGNDRKNPIIYNGTTEPDPAGGKDTTAITELIGLVTGAGELTPAFASGTTSYTASVPYGATSTAMIPTLADEDATVTVNGTPVTSGAFSSWIELNAGSNTITTVATAKDGATTQTYTLTVTRLNGNADLTSLVPSAGTLNPAFESATTSYTARVPNGKTSITVTPTTADTTATVTVNGVIVPSGTASDPIALNVGDNIIPIVVTAQDPTITKTYTLIVTRMGPPFVTTLAASAVTFDGVTNVATLNGAIIANGLATKAHFEYGLTTAYGTSTANQNVGAGTTEVSVHAGITNLLPNTTYHYRAVATNSSGTTNGLDQLFTTPENAVAGTWAEHTEVRNLRTAVGEEVDIGTLTFTGGTGSIEVAVNASSTGWHAAKRYLIPIRTNLGNGSPPATWLKVLPTHDTGPSSANDFDLDINVSSAAVLLRLRTVRSSGAPATATIAIKTTGLKTFANSASATFVPLPPTLTAGGNAVDELNGKAGIGVAPSANAVLDINGGDTRGLRLRPRSTPGAPTTGMWHIGTLILDSDANLFICTTPGTPGTWLKVGPP